MAREIKTEKGISPAVPASEPGGFVDCIAVSISPDLGERISLSAEKSLIEEVSISWERVNGECMGWQVSHYYSFVHQFLLYSMEHDETPSV